MRTSLGTDVEPIRKKKNKGTWKKGQSGNPKGGKKKSVEWHLMPRLSITDVQITINKLVKMPREDFHGHLKKDDVPIIELMIGSVIQKAILLGDPARVDFLLNRLVGKVPTKTEIGSDYGLVAKTLTTEEVRSIIIRDPFIAQRLGDQNAGNRETTVSTGTRLPEKEEPGVIEVKRDPFTDCYQVDNGEKCTNPSDQDSSKSRETGSNSSGTH